MVEWAGGGVLRQNPEKWPRVGSAFPRTVCLKPMASPMLLSPPALTSGNSGVHPCVSAPAEAPLSLGSGSDGSWRTGLLCGTALAVFLPP